ncbi:hypothetical protein QBC37DRAFT_382834 [Rhypophila decipiens]|uniref:Uncharacterized protein n=1 Tax=Rhypophila decipiens TaxID=261697 RepID=A0AAN6YIJ9_9PEZI|nr:hypothetical protein QBC37DRAFT_382834 [Rhypophila decipiens]
MMMEEGVCPERVRKVVTKVTSKVTIISTRRPGGGRTPMMNGRMQRSGQVDNAEAQVELPKTFDHGRLPAPVYSSDHSYLRSAVLASSKETPLQVPAHLSGNNVRSPSLVSYTGKPKAARVTNSSAVVCFGDPWSDYCVVDLCLAAHTVARLHSAPFPPVIGRMSSEVVNKTETKVQSYGLTEDLEPINLPAKRLYYIALAHHTLVTVQAS